MTGIVLLALLCPAQAPDCTVDSAQAVISHTLTGECGPALLQLMMEAAASPIQGGEWTFSCKAALPALGQRQGLPS